MVADESSQGGDTAEVMSDYDDDVIKEEEVGDDVPSKNETRNNSTWLVSLCLCLVLAGVVVGGIAIASSGHVCSSHHEEPRPYQERDCCDPVKEPGFGSNPLCSEGHACCPDGTWSCYVGDAKAFPCGDEPMERPEGIVCDSAAPGCLNSNSDDIGCLKTEQELLDYCADLGCANRDCTEKECITLEEAENCWMHCETFDCFLTCNELEAVIGRPFKETTSGNAILAKARPENCNQGVCLWAKSSHSLSSSTPSQEQDIVADAKLSTAEDWIEQGLGEHASIASFASFTIALMTNQAPPDLIRDALRAALDELDHAERSFGMAKLIASDGQRVMAPGSLPPSKLEFKADLTDLAMSTALEGCIGETMSALELAMEADEIAATLDEDGTSEATMESISFENLWKIAMDEARHSSLAWKTIHWVCQTNEDACTLVKERVLNTKYLSKMALSAKRFGKNEGTARAAWKRIYESLLPVIDAPRCAFTSKSYCGSETEASSKTGVSQLVDAIVRDVACRCNEKSVH